jgi:GntR family transcriptional regulator
VLIMATQPHPIGLPHYVRIREDLRAEMQTGRLEPGQKLPCEDELASRYGVSRMTVRQSLTDLIDEGLVFRRHGVGTFVAPRHIDRDHSRLTNFFEKAEQDGVRAEAQVLSKQIVPAKRQVASALGLDEGDPVIEIKTLRLANDVPLAVHDAHLPYRLVPDLLKADIASGPIWSLLEGDGYRVKQAVQRVEAREADEELAELLGIEEGAPILYKERTVYAQDGTALEFVYCYNRGDRYSLTMTLSR